MANSDMPIEHWAKAINDLSKNTKITAAGFYKIRLVGGKFKDEFDFRRSDFDTILHLKDNRFPDADVRVQERKIDKSSPRNPNPKAGSVKAYVIVIGEKVSQPFMNSVVACSRAKNIHEKMVKELDLNRGKDFPMWGDF